VNQHATKISTEVSPPGRPQGAASWKGRESPRRISLYLGAGTIAIYLATWADNLIFYVEFQRPLLTQCGGSAGCLLRTRARRVEKAGSESWDLHEEQGVEAPLPLPPGRLVKLTRVGDLCEAELPEGILTIQMFPAGCVAEILKAELESLGAPAARELTDAGALREIVEEDLGKYEFAWEEPRRRAYAARILAKMLLWENKPARRLELASRGEPPRAAALVEYETGGAKIIVVREAGDLVILVPPEAPAAWKASPASWIPEKR
jgi:hypothetical protein